MSDRQEYRLSEQENERIFQERVKPFLLREASKDLRPSEHPTMVMVGGQPGAGKSKSIAAVRQELEKHGGVLQIAADDLRDFHPSHRKLMRQDDRTAANYTHADASLWAEKAERFARQERFNVLLEGTMKTPENTAAKLAEYRREGYSTETRIIAVHERDSWQGVVSRYESQKLDRGTGRMTPKPVHDAAVKGLLATVEKIEREKLADRVRVDRRGGEMIYSNDLQADGRRERAAGARVAIEEERGRAPTAEQWSHHVKGFDRIVALQTRPGRNAPADDVRMIRDLRAAAIVERDRTALRERNADAAASFQNDRREVALAKHPRLAGAYAAVDLMAKEAAKRGIKGEVLDGAMSKVRGEIARNVQAGRYPELKTPEQSRPPAAPPSPTRDRER